MDKKIDKQNSEEEYKPQGTGMESTAHFSGGNSGTETASAILEKTKRQHIFLVLIVIFASLGVYKVVNKLIHGFSAKQKLVEKLQKPTMPVVPSAAVQTKITLANRFNQLEQGQRDLQSNLHSFDTEVSDIKSTLADLDTRIAQINDQTQALRTQQEAFLQKQQTAENKKVARKKATPKPIYYVRAMIPGRVWLVKQDESTDTFVLGDKLLGYGSITAIDPNQGTVTLSEGEVIGYSPDDR